MTQFNYTPTFGKLGSRATGDPVVSVSRIYASQPQISTITFGGVATDGTYTQPFEGLPVANIPISVVRAAAVPLTNTDLATEFVVQANNNADIRSLFLVTSAAAVVTVVARENGTSFTLGATTAPAPGTLVNATTQTGTPANLPMGIAVVYAGTGLNVITQPDASSTAFEIQGLTWDGQSSADATVIPTLGQGTDFESPFSPGSMVPVAQKGVFWVHPEVDVAQGDPVFVRMTATGTEVFGQLSNVTDGGDNLQIQGVWERDGSANSPTMVRINLPGGA